MRVAGDFANGFPGHSRTCVQKWTRAATAPTTRCGAVLDSGRIRRNRTMTIAASPAFAATDRAAAPPARFIALLTAATGIASLALLAIHPGDAATDFAGVLKEEAANRVTDALVHGGFIAVLAVQAVCYAVFSARLGWQRTATVAGFVFFCAGVAFLSGSMVLDGLVTPAIAVRYVAAPAKIESARTLFVLIGTLISFLMPIGLAFQSAAIAAWGWALTAGGKRMTGLLGLVLGIAMLAASFTTPLALMVAMAGTALWALVAGSILFRPEPRA